MESGKELNTFCRPGEIIRFVSFARNGASTFVGTYHGPSPWWDVSHGKIMRAIDVRYILAISPDGTRIVTSNGELRDASTGSLIRPLTSGTFETRLYVAAFLQIAERSMGGI